MDRQEILTHLKNALKDLFTKDAHLLDVDCSERSLSHCFAIRLSKEFPDFDVDCEYNRVKDKVKRIQYPAPHTRRTRSNATKAVTVFPDIIVHKRGTNTQNQLVIEVKKKSNKPDKLRNHDIKKLNAFLDSKALAYRYGVHLIIGSSTEEVTIEFAPFTKTQSPRGKKKWKASQTETWPTQTASPIGLSATA